MEYEPQTLSEEEITARLESFDKEFDIIAHSVDVLCVSSEKILTTLDQRLTTLMDHLEPDPTNKRLRDA